VAAVAAAVIDDHAAAFGRDPAGHSLALFKDDLLQLAGLFTGRRLKDQFFLFAVVYEYGSFFAGQIAADAGGDLFQQQTEVDLGIEVEHFFFKTADAVHCRSPLP